MLAKYTSWWILCTSKCTTLYQGVYLTWQSEDDVHLTVTFGETVTYVKE